MTMLTKKDIHAIDADVVIRSIESFGAPKLRALEASFEALEDFLGTSWRPLGGLLGIFWGVLREP